MSSSFGELVGLCHFIHSQVTPAISSSGGKGGNGTLHEVNRSTTSLNSLGRAERDRGWERMGERDRRDRVRDTHMHTQMETVNGRNSNIKMDNREGAIQELIIKRDLACLPCTHVIFSCKAEGVS